MVAAPLTGCSSRSKGLADTDDSSDVSHWQMVFMRFACIQAAYGQFSMVAALLHLDTICHLVEKETIRSGQAGTGIALLYEEMVRRSWADRSRRRDPMVASVQHLEFLAARVDENILSEARTRIGSVLRHTGLTLMAAPRDTPVVDDASLGEAVRNRQLGAIDELNRNTQVALRQAAREKAEAEQRAATMRKAETGDTRSAKQRKADDWYNKIRENEAHGEDWRDGGTGGKGAYKGKGAKPGKGGGRGGRKQDNPYNGGGQGNGGGNQRAPLRRR